MKQLLIKFRTLTRTDIAAVCLISAAFFYLFITASFNGTISDEAFYLSVPFRIMNGDGLFTDEWHLSQLSSVLLYIPVKLFTAFTGSTKGIILFSRRLFCLMQLITGVYTYKTFRKHGLSAVLMSLLFMLFSIIGVETLSYNTMGVSLLMIIICLIYNNITNEPSYIRIFAEGSLIAMFILCQPLGIILFGIRFILTVTVNILNKKKEKTVPVLLTVKAFCVYTAGIIPVLAFFLYLLLKNSDIETIIRCIPGILSDVEHMQLTEELGIKTFSLIQFFSDMSMSAGAVPLIAAVMLFVISVIISKKNKHLAVIISSFALAVFFITFYIRLFFTNGTTETDDISFFFLPLALSGLPFYLLSEKKDHKIFILLWCTGFMYALFMTVSSNLALHASVNGYIIASFGSLILARELFNELKEEDCDTKKTVKAVSAILAAAVFGFTVFQTGTMVIKPSAERAYFKSAKMTNGIYEGISLPSDQALLYTNIYNDAQRIKEKTQGKGKLFVTENLSAMYLESGLSMGVHSGWFIAEQLMFPEIRDRFREYYEINPENIPDYLYVPAYSYEEHGMKPFPAKMMADFAYNLFSGEAEDIGSGLLIKVTEIKDE